MSAPLVTPLALWLQRRTGGTLHVWATPQGWMREVRGELAGT